MTIAALGRRGHIVAISFVGGQVTDSVHFIPALSGVTVAVHAGETRCLVDIGSQLEITTPGAVCFKCGLIARKQSVVLAIKFILDPGTMTGSAIVVHGRGLVKAMTADQTAAGRCRDGDVTLAAGSGGRCAGTYGGVAFGALFLETHRRIRRGVGHVEAALHEDGVVTTERGVQAVIRACDFSGMTVIAGFCGYSGNEALIVSGWTGAGGTISTVANGTFITRVHFACCGKDGIILSYGTIENPDFFDAGTGATEPPQPSPSERTSTSVTGALATSCS